MNHTLLAKVRVLIKILFGNYGVIIRRSPWRCNFTAYHYHPVCAGMAEAATDPSTPYHGCGIKRTLGPMRRANPLAESRPYTSQLQFVLRSNTAEFQLPVEFLIPVGGFRIGGFRGLPGRGSAALTATRRAHTTSPCKDLTSLVRPSSNVC
jgi:hypothetical protein